MQLATLRHRVANLVSRVAITKVTDTGKTQRAQAKSRGDELLEGLEVMSQYGFSSRPKDGAEGVAVFPGGDRGHGLIIAVNDRRFRFKALEAGEVALYTDEGDLIHFKRGRELAIETQTLRVAAEKVSFTNTAGTELVAVLSEVLEALTSATTATALGPQPLLPPPPQTWALLKAKLDQLKDS